MSPIAHRMTRGQMIRRRMIITSFLTGYHLPMRKVFQTQSSQGESDIRLLVSSHDSIQVLRG
ncbi:hypothetical protein Taro_020393 [Colocasia esculenta]|uniref:Uncharacterized protein n=1 Tax=Colocasia esculenta TaxID=4460 RepID=A0A843V1Z3_COLES|nr:hypothetical protein [Colocasia esculenta]